MWKAGYIGQTRNSVRGLDDRRCRLTGLHLYGMVSWIGRFPKRRKVDLALTILSN